jgi:hypothetical protein
MAAGKESEKELETLIAHGSDDLVAIGELARHCVAISVVLLTSRDGPRRRTG